MTVTRGWSYGFASNETRQVVRHAPACCFYAVTAELLPSVTCDYQSGRSWTARSPMPSSRGLAGIWGNRLFAQPMTDLAATARTSTNEF